MLLLLLDFFDGKEMKAHLTPPIMEQQPADVLSWTTNLGMGPVPVMRSDVNAQLPFPAPDLSLDWVYGYSSRTTRAAVRYNSEVRICNHNFLHFFLIIFVLLSFL